LIIEISSNQNIIISPQQRARILLAAVFEFHTKILHPTRTHFTKYEPESHNNNAYPEGKIINAYNIKFEFSEFNVHRRTTNK
jgi:hypothetical protein